MGNPAEHTHIYERAWSHDTRNEAMLPAFVELTAAAVPSNADDEDVQLAHEWSGSKCPAASAPVHNGVRSVAKGLKTPPYPSRGNTHGPLTNALHELAMRVPSML